MLTTADPVSADLACLPYKVYQYGSTATGQYDRTPDWLLLAQGGT